MTTDSAMTPSRAPGQAAIESLLASHAAATPRSRFARALGRNPLTEENRARHLAATGELAVGAILERLPAGWTARHSLPIGSGDGDIDHLVIGPGGAFTIATRHHRGRRIHVSGRKFLVAGRMRPYLRLAEAEAEFVSALIMSALEFPVPVHPVVAVVGPRLMSVSRLPCTVAVLDATTLPAWIASQPRVLSDRDLSALFRTVDAQAGWRAVADDPADLINRFRTLDAEVQQARHRRTLVDVVGVSLSFIGGAVASVLAFEAYAMFVLGVG